MTITVTGSKAPEGSYRLYRGAGYVVDFLPNSKLEVAVNNDAVERVVEEPMHAANTGKIGDGKIFVGWTRWCASAPAAQTPTL